MSSEKRSIVVSLPRHEISIFQDGKEVRPRISDFSTGRNGYETPLGEFWISPRWRLAIHFSSKYLDSSGHGAAMPYSLFLAKSDNRPVSGSALGDKFKAHPTAVAFHAGDPNVDSHGCIHLTESDARWLFHWVGGHDVHVKILGPRIPYHFHGLHRS
jgi:lipoprotein-anchoring transpeptidase ErfK/SrfK